jgi:predicted SprT family Zn-dependent metalloprotease
MTIESDLRAAFTRHMEHACRLYPELTRIQHNVVFIVKPNMGNKAGTARGYREVCVNLTLARQNFDHIANNTIPHEIAHIICSYFAWDKGHGRMWKRVASSLGIAPERCFDSVATGMQPVMMRQRSKYLHKATCGTEIWLSDVMHGKLLKGSNRIISRTGGKLNASTYMGKVK